MYTLVWNKYLPIIRILMKKSGTADQQLNMNAIDFERAGAGRKAGYKFMILFRNGRVDNVISASPLAKDLAATMLLDEAAASILSRNDFQINMTSKYQLQIQLLSKEEEPADISAALPGEQEGSATGNN